MEDINGSAVAKLNNKMRIVDKDNSITVSQFEGDLDPEDESLIPVPDDLASYVSTALQSVPALATNTINYNVLDRTLYTVTFDGKNVLPEQLYQKGNGHFISNLKGDGKE